MCFTYSLQLTFWALMPAICMGFLLSRWDLFRSHCTHHPLAPVSTCYNPFASPFYQNSEDSSTFALANLKVELVGSSRVANWFDTLGQRKVCQAYFHKWTKREKTAWLPYYRLISGRVILDLQEQSGSETKEDGEQIRILKDLINRSSPCESFTS